MSEILILKLSKLKEELETKSKKLEESKELLKSNENGESF